MPRETLMALLVAEVFIIPAAVCQNSNGTVTLNFDSVPVAAGSCADGTGYLNNFGITLSAVTPGSSVLICAQGSPALPIATSPPNYLNQYHGNNPETMTLNFAHALNKITFYRTGLTYDSKPEWTAEALNDQGAVVASVGEPLTATGAPIPAQQFMLSGTGITAMRINSNNGAFTNLSGVPIDDLTLIEGCQVNVTPLSQGDSRWAHDQYDHKIWITRDFSTPDRTAVTTSPTLELLVGSTIYAIPLSASNNNLTSLRDLINNRGAGIQASVVPRINNNGQTYAYYLAITDTVGLLCQICGGPANNLQLRTIPGSPQSNLLTTTMIQNVGCALTALTMALNAAASKYGFAGIPSFPNQLNEFMIRWDVQHPMPPHAYDGVADVDWINTVTLVGNSIGKPLQLDRTSLRCDYTATCFTQPSPIVTYIDDAVCKQGLPVIVGVNEIPFSPPDHFALITGKTGDRYVIRDPGFSNRDGGFLDDYYSSFETRGFVYDPPADRSDLGVSVGDPVELLVIDPTGKRVGFDSASGQVVKEIPNSVYWREGLQDDITRAAPSSISHTVHIPQPGPGLYRIILTGLQLGSYTLQVGGFSTAGQPLTGTLLQGVTGPASNATFQVQFVPTVGSTLTAFRVATFQSTLVDISNSLQLSLIDSDGIANSLSQKVRAAESATGSARKEVLNAFKNEVNAQSGKHITGVAVQVLLQDADSLLVPTP